MACQAKKEENEKNNDVATMIYERIFDLSFAF